MNAAAPVASSPLPLRQSSAPPPLAARLSHPSGSTAQAQAAQALATAVPAGMPSQAPAPVVIPVRRSSEGDRRDDDLSGVRARPRFLDQRTLMIGGAVLLGVLGAVVLLRGKPAASTPPPAADTHTEEPPATASTGATTPPSSAGATTGTTGVSAPGATTPGGAALPSALAAAVAPPVPAAEPAKVAPEPVPGRVEVQVSEIRVKGGKLRTKDLLAALGDGLKDVEHCYEEVLEDRPKTAGELSYSFTLDKKGNPTKVKKAGGAIKDARLLKCTERAIEKADFPKPKSKPAQVTLPLEFKKS